MKNKLSIRFSELILQADEVASTARTSHTQQFGSSTSVADDVHLGWVVKVKNLLVKVGGEDCVHYKEFVKTEGHSSWSGNMSMFNAQKAILVASKEDFDGGYLSSYKAIVQADVFDTELEQANELLQSGYFVAAAVVTGVVLETALRELCDRTNIPVGKLDKMNADLAKAAVYSKVTQKQITAYAGIRNSAAHGNSSEFSKSDVEQMVPAVEQFLSLIL
ncbi:MAG: hypothetical protein K6L80_16375 [Agarilytica sp.]